MQLIHVESIWSLARWIYISLCSEVESMLSRWILDKKLAGLPPMKKWSKLQMDSRDPPGLAFKSLVQSGFWTLIGHNCNHNQLQLHHHIQETGLNHMGPVQISPVVVHQLVLTSPIEDQLEPVATGPTIGMNWSSIQNNTMLHIRY